MKVFISYSERDREFALQLKERLSNEKNIKIYFDEHSLEMGGNIERIMMRKLEEFDYYLIVLSKYSVKSKYLMIELDRVVFREIKSEKQTIIPIAIDEYAFEFPVLREFSRRQLIDFSKSFDNGYKGLIKRLNQDQQQKLAIKEFNPEETKKINDNYLKEIKEEFKKGSLCLFCGAGVSIKAGIPNWSFLLKGLLQNLVDKQLGDFSIDPKKQRQLAEFYYDEFGVSSLIVGQYLKNGLGESFLEDVREALYQNNPSDSDILNTIVELCRPQRERKTLNSIITFNFDDLIEKNLIKNRIKHRPIHSEGQRALNSEIPIYHPHGYLPRGQKLTEQNEIVFSEDAYHSQFIEPFSWSNLVQLNHLNNNTCLLVGISLTDPNLRRLLDVSMRKNPDKQLRHYIFKRRYSTDEIKEKLEKSELSGDKNFFTNNFIYMTELLEEQDARKLGLNVIWIKDFDEINSFLTRLNEE